MREPRFQQLLELAVGFSDQMNAGRIGVVLECLGILRVNTFMGGNLIWESYLKRFCNDLLKNATPSQLRRVISATVDGDPGIDYIPYLTKITDRICEQIVQCDILDILVVTNSLSATPELKRHFRNHKWF
eukprot:UN31386